MAGRKLLTNILISLLLLMPSLAVADQSDHIAVLLSDTLEAYSAPLDAFRDEIGMEIKVYNLHGQSRLDPQLKSQVLSRQPKLLFALGAKAAYAAKLWTIDHQEIAVVFSMVYNWQKYKLLAGQDNMAGIAAEIAPGTQFINLSMFVPTAKRIGVIYSTDHSTEMVIKAREATAMLGIELVERQVRSTKEFKYTYRKLSGQVDGLWILNDPLTYTLDNMAWVKNRCLKDKLVCMGQSEHLTEAGIVLSVLPDITNIGSQAASLAKSIIVKGESPKNFGVMSPLGTFVMVNLRTAKRVGVHFSSQALGMATKVIE